jgi:peptidoglycan hydrolase-like protein with peptidoglycan-binding domain
MEPNLRGPEQATEGGTCPSVGRYGNWFRNGDQVVILLEEDQAPLDQGAQAASTTNGGPEAPPEAGAPSEEPSDGSTEDTQGELAGRGGLSRRNLSLIQHALNHLKGLRLSPYGLSDPQTRSALRSYQQQKGLTPHGRANYETELALASDIANVQRDYETEFGGGDPCVARCFDIFNDCIRRSTSPLNCLARLSTCQRSCGSEPPIPPTPIPPVPVPPAPCPPRATLRFGSRGPAVEELQRRLNAKGATPQLKVDGNFGPLTNAAVRAFQRSRGLVIDGVVGPNTWAALGC